jgi:hypothetical protein
MVIGLSRMACGRSEWKGMILSTFGGDEDSGLAGPKGFTAERGGSNGTAATLPAARSMSFMRSHREPCAASSEWPASQRKCSIRAILLPSTNAVPQAAPSCAQIGRQGNGERKAILASLHEHYEQVSISNTKTGSGDLN